MILFQGHVQPARQATGHSMQAAWQCNWHTLSSHSTRTASEGTWSLLLYIAPADYHCRGSLYHALRTGDRPLKLVFVLEYAHGIAAGMVHLHAHHVLHRDLKSANVLIGDRCVAQYLSFPV